MIAFLTQPAQLQIDVGTQAYNQNFGAGLVSFMVPLQPGVITFKIIRAGVVALSLTSPWQVQSSVEYQDMLYRTGSTSVAISSAAASTSENNAPSGSSGCGMGSSVGLLLGVVLLSCSRRRSHI